MNSLNRIYRTIWSEALGAWIAVSEITKAKGKRSGSALLRALRIGGVSDETDDIHSHRFKPIIIALACCFALNAQANPNGGTVVNGSANFNNSGNTLTVTNTPGTIINWQGFSIGANEVTRFVQQSASSTVLNRVVTNNPSVILGTLQSNGQVYLVNANGIMFGAGSTVDVAGLVATSLNLSDADFLAGRHNYTAVAGAQNVSNSGNINAQQGGQIYLIAPNVENNGVITAPNGEVLLAAGHSVELVNSNDPNLRVQITAPAGAATNLGQIIVESGNLGLFGAVVRNSGTASADSVTMEGGRIVFKSSQRTEVSGTVSATGTTGGTIEALSSNEVQIAAGANLDASGTNGGGTILVGGDKQGANPDVVNALTTYVDATASIKADATQNGDGGKVIVWADEVTRAHGDISAQGGANGGNGGFVETSAHYLDVAGIRVDASAQHGDAGMWLLDPLNVTLGTTGSTTGGTFAAGVWTPSAPGSFIHTGLIGTMLDGGTNVTITTVNAGFAEAGDINVNASISKTIGTAGTLTLLAENNINFAVGAGVSSASGALNVVLHSDSDGSGAGTVTFGGTNTFSLLGGRVDLYYNPTSYATPTTFAPTLVSATLTPWMLVNNVTNLQDMSTNLAGNYALGTNIDATATATWNLGAGFAPIGNSLTAFTGNVDGLGHTINGLTINRSTTDYVGLFGYIGSGTNIKNVTLTNVNITGQQYVGGLVGTSYFSTLDGVTISGMVSGMNYVGGLLGDSIYLGTVNNSNSSVNVTASNGNAGGLVGRSQLYSTISASIASGTVTGASNVGGLAGYSGFNSTISGSSATGAVSGVIYVGGLVGRNAGIITTSSASGTVSGNSQVGGLAGYNVWAGYNLSGTVECSFGCTSYTYGNINTGSTATGNVTGVTDVGGLVGYNNSGATIDTGNYSVGTVTGNSNVGGLAGNNYGTVANSFSTGSVVGSGALRNAIGGLVGNNFGAISSSYVTNAAVSGSFHVGGLVGLNSGTINNSNVSNASVAGSITVGGLIGINNSSVSNSYVSGGSVTATRQIGGLIGSGAGASNSYYNIDAVLLNGGALVTRGGIYNTQYAAWVAGGYVPLNIANYSASLPFSVTAYQVGSVQSLRDMLAFADNPAYSFIMTASIDLTAAPGLYIPYLAATSFDGAGFTISNLNINVPNAGMGMFGTTVAGTTVTNLTLQDATVNGASAVGSIIGLNGGALSNSHSSRSVTGLISGSSSVGGLVGNNSFGATITNSYVSSGAVTATVRNIGGVVGSDGGTRTNSYFNIDTVTTNGGNNVTVAGLYTTQYNDWFNGGLLTPLVIGNYASLVLQLDGSYGISTQQGLKDMLGFADNPAYNFSLTGSVDLTGMAGFYVPKLGGDFNGNGFTLSNLSLALPNYSMGLFGVTNTASLITNLNLLNATVSGYGAVGTLVGSNFGDINLVSVTGTVAASAAGAIAGGLVGENSAVMTTLGALVGGNISNSFVSGGTVTGGNINVGGLVGFNRWGNVVASHVDNTAVSGTSNVGGLVGSNQANGGSFSSSGVQGGNITNSYVSNGSVTSTGIATDSSIGGLVGLNLRGAISGSYVLNPTVIGGVASMVGGLVGNNRGGVNSIYQGPSTPSLLVYSGFISNSYVSGGTVASTGIYVGGLVGNQWSGKIDLSYVDSVSVSGNTYVGGLVGFDGGEGITGHYLGIISNSHAFNTQVSGSTNVGGLVGYLGTTATGFNVPTYDAVVNSYVDGGTVIGLGITGTGLIGPNGVGGLIGLNDHGNVGGSYVTGGTVVSAVTNSSVGGLVGYNFGGTYLGVVNSGYISGGYVNGGIVTGGNAVGGLAGTNTGVIRDSHVTAGLVLGSGTVGGLVGDNGRDILRSYVANTTVGTTVTSGTATDFGGLVGMNSGSISQSFVSGGIVGAVTAVALYEVGGLVGWNTSTGSISNSYVDGGTVSGDFGVGGLIGVNTGSVLQSYTASGLVSGGVNVGGLIGNNDLPGTVSDSFWDINTTGQALGFGQNLGNTIGVAGLTTAQRMTMSSFTGWSIANTGGAGMIWRIYEGRTGPMLTSFLTQATVTANNATKTYDGVTYSGGNGVTTSVIALNGGSVLGTFGGTSQVARNAGIYVIDATGLYSDQFGYDITGYTNGTLTVSQATLTLNAVTDSRIYDGTTLSGGVVNVVGLGLGDNVTATQSFGSKNVLGLNGSTLAVDAGYVVNDGNGGANYIVLSNTATGTISAATLNIDAVTDSRVYDGTTASAGIVNIAGLVGGDTVTGATQIFGSKNVLGVSGSTLTVNGYTINDGNGGANYIVASGTATGTISAATLNIDAVTDSRVYDGTTASAGIVNIAGLVGGDTVTGATQIFGSKNVLGVSGSTLTVNGYTINDGNGGANYTVVSNTATGTITAAALSLTAGTDTKVYDGTTGSAGIVGITGLFGADSVTGATQSFVSKNVLGTNGSTLTVDAGYVVNDGNGGANYTVVSNTATGTINTATLNIDAVTDAKVYDGTTSSAGAVNVAGLVGGDTVSGATQTFGSKDVLGVNGSTLTVNGYTINDGNGGANYTVVSNTASGTITPAMLTVTADSLSKYEGLADPALTYTVGGLQVGDTLPSTLTGTLDRVLGEAIGSYLIGQGSLTLMTANYTLNYVPGTFSIVGVPPITPPILSSLVDSTEVIDSFEDDEKKRNTLLADADGQSNDLPLPADLPKMVCK